MTRAATLALQEIGASPLAVRALTNAAPIGLRAGAKAPREASLAPDDMERLAEWARLAAIVELPRPRALPPRPRGASPLKQPLRPIEQHRAAMRTIE